MANLFGRRGKRRRMHLLRAPNVIDPGRDIRSRGAREVAGVNKGPAHDVPAANPRASRSSQASRRIASHDAADSGRDSRSASRTSSRGSSRSSASGTSRGSASGGSHNSALGGSSRSPRHAPPHRAHDTYVRPRVHEQRGGRGARSRITFAGGLLRLGIGAAVVAAVVLAIVLMTRPASAIITATPGDATILFNGSVAGTGSLEVEDLDSGTYTIQVTRSGFTTETVTAELKRGHRAKLEYDLAPEPQTVSVTTTPAGALCTITRASGESTSAAAPFATNLLAGEVTLTIALDGYNTFTRTFFLDSPLALEYNLDPAGQVLHGVGLITTLGAPKGVSITPDGTEAWTSILDGPPSIQIFDPYTGEDLGDIDLGDYGAVEVIFNKAGTLAYTSQMETGKCFEIDVKSHTVLREFNAESTWTKWVQLSPDEKTLYASNWSGDDVSIIDLTTGELVKRIGVSNTPRGMYATADGLSLYVAGFDSGELERIDLSSYAVTTVFNSDGGALRHIVADEAKGVLYISDMAQDVIWVHDMATGTTTKFADTDEKPNTIDLSPGGDMLFVSCRGENNAKSYYLPGPEWGSIIVYDTKTGKPLDALICGNQPTALDVSDDGRLLISSDFLDNRLRVYEIPSYETFLAADGGRFEAHLAEIKK